MTRETKVGLVVATTFLCLVGGVLAVKYIRGTPMPAPAPAEMAQAPIELPPGLNLPDNPPPPAPLYGNNPAPSSSARDGAKPTSYNLDGPPPPLPNNDPPVAPPRLTPPGNLVPPPIDDVPGLKPIARAGNTDPKPAKITKIAMPKTSRPDEDDEFKPVAPPPPLKSGLRPATHEEPALPAPGDKGPPPLPTPGDKGPPPLIDLPKPDAPKNPGTLKLDVPPPMNPVPSTPIDLPGFKPASAKDDSKPMGGPPSLDLPAPGAGPTPPPPPMPEKKDTLPIPAPIDGSRKPLDLPPPGGSESKPPIDLPKPPVDLPGPMSGGIKPPIDLPKPMGGGIKPPIDLPKPPVDLPGPMSGGIKPPIDPKLPTDPPPLPPEFRKAPEAVKPVDPPAASLGARPGPGETPEPRVDSYDEEWYYCKPGDTLEAISQKFFFSPKYEQALRQYNLDRNAQPVFRQERPNLGQGTVVKVPPARILERSYPTMIAGFKGTGNPNPASPAAVTPGGTAELGSPREYMVRKENMTLRDIAREELRDANQWTRIFQLNRGLNPNETLPVGTRIHMPGNP